MIHTYIHNLNINLIQQLPIMLTLFSSLVLKQFLPYIVHPSGVSENPSTPIDNIFSNISDNETVSGSILTLETDHFFSQLLIVKHAGISYKNLSYYKHDFSKFNEGDLQNDF